MRHFRFEGPRKTRVTFTMRDSDSIAHDTLAPEGLDNGVMAIRSRIHDLLDAGMLESYAIAETVTIIRRGSVHYRDDK